jgi:hypothetical protein
MRDVASLRLKSRFSMTPDSYLSIRLFRLGMLAIDYANSRGVIEVSEQAFQHDEDIHEGEA